MTLTRSEPDRGVVAAGLQAAYQRSPRGEKNQPGVRITRTTIDHDARHAAIVVRLA
jgi:hypothetical protein